MKSIRAPRSNYQFVGSRRLETEKMLQAPDVATGRSRLEKAIHTLKPVWLYSKGLLYYFLWFCENLLSWELKILESTLFVHIRSNPKHHPIKTSWNGSCEVDMRNKEPSLHLAPRCCRTPPQTASGPLEHCLWDHELMQFPVWGQRTCITLQLVYQSLSPCVAQGDCICGAGGW